MNDGDTWPAMILEGILPAGAAANPGRAFARSYDQEAESQEPIGADDRYIFAETWSVVPEAERTAMLVADEFFPIADDTKTRFVWSTAPRTMIMAEAMDLVRRHAYLAPEILPTGVRAAFAVAMVAECGDTKPSIFDETLAYYSAWHPSVAHIIAVARIGAWFHFCQMADGVRVIWLVLPKESEDNDE